MRRKRGHYPLQAALLAVAAHGNDEDGGEGMSRNRFLRRRADLEIRREGKEHGGKRAGSATRVNPNGKRWCDGEQRHQHQQRSSEAGERRSMRVVPAAVAGGWETQLHGGHGSGAGFYTGWGVPMGSIGGVSLVSTLIPEPALAKERLLGVKISHRYKTVAILSLPHRDEGKKQCPEQETGRDRRGV